MEILQLKYFKDAAETENFSKAAEKNMVPQPSISSSIKWLENELSVPLFDRSGRKIFLNENGDFFMSPLDADFTTAHPNTHIIYATVEQVLRSQKSPYDFTFMELLDNMNDYNYDIILEDKLVALVSIEHPLSSCDTIDVSQLKDEHFIGLYDTIPMQVLVNKFCQNHGQFTPNYIFKSHDNFATIYKVAHNEGVAILPQKYYSVHPSNKLKMINLKNTVSSKLVIAWDKSKILSPLESAFLQYTREWFQKI